MNPQPNNPVHTRTLLNLPVELRLAVYDHLIIVPRSENNRPGMINMVATRDQNGNPEENSPCSLPQVRNALQLFAVCRLLYNEAGPVFFSSHHFCIPLSIAEDEHAFHPYFAHQFPVIEYFINTIGRWHAADIRHLTIPFPADLSREVSTSPLAYPNWSEDTHETMLLFLLRGCPDLRTVHMERRSTWNFIVFTWQYFFHTRWAGNKYFRDALDTISRDYFAAFKELKITWDHNWMFNIPISHRWNQWFYQGPCGCCPLERWNFEDLVKQLK